MRTFKYNRGLYLENISNLSQLRVENKYLSVMRDYRA